MEQIRSFNELVFLNTAVHMNKGCYRSRDRRESFNLGRPPRRDLFSLHLDGSDGSYVEHGAKVTLDGKEIGLRLVQWLANMS
jgi:hypothetical protein